MLIKTNPNIKMFQHHMQGPKNMEEKLDDDKKKKWFEYISKEKNLEKLKLSGILVF